MGEMVGLCRPGRHSLCVVVDESGDCAISQGDAETVG
jgi:hypothetical protein